jgi:hypothetical protein
MDVMDDNARERAKGRKKERQTRRDVVEEVASRRCVGSANPLPGFEKANQRAQIP